MFDSVTAEYNGRYGLYFDYDAVQAYGDATFIINGLTASYNGEDGMYIHQYAAYSTDDGDAYFSLHDAFLYANGASGFYIGEHYGAAHAADGNATAIFDDVYSGYNADYGLYFGGYVAYADHGNAIASFENLYVVYNGDYGIMFKEAGAYSDSEGFAYFGMSNAYFDANGTAANVHFDEHGAYAVDGQAFASFYDIDSYNADEAGVYFTGYGAYSAISDAYFSWNGFNAYYNGDSGVYFRTDVAHSAGDGNAVVTFDDWVLYANGERGAYFREYVAYASGDGDAWLMMDDVYARLNGQDGLYFDDQAAWADAGSATALFSGITAINNADYGVIFQDDVAYAETVGDARFEFGGYLYSNGEDGLHVGGNGARSVSGAATTRLMALYSNYNDDFGVYFDDNGAFAQGPGSDAFFGFTNGSVSYNGESGFYVTDFAAYAGQRR